MVGSSTGQPQYFKIVYAVQQPHYLAVCKMHLLDTPRPVPPAGASVMETHLAYAKHQFKINFADMMSASGMPEASQDSLAILFNIRFGGVSASTQWDPMPLAELIRGSPTPANAELKPKSEPKPKDKVYEEIVLELPWLTHLDDKEGYAKEDVDVSEPSSSKSAPAELFELDEEACLAALDKVDRARSAEAVVALAQGFVDFVTSECRGDSTLRITGIYHDAVQGKCATAEGDSWARRKKLQVTFKCTFSEHVEGPSRIIVRAWCHRMQWMYNREVVSGTDDFVFTDAVMSEYLEPDDFTKLVPTLTKKTSLDRVAKIRKLPFR